MSRSLAILLLLLLLGAGAGFILQNYSPLQKQASARKAGANPQTSSAPQAAQTPEANSEEEPSPILPGLIPPHTAAGQGQDRQVEILQSQVQYLEQQVQALTKENSDLVDKLASIQRGMKPGEITPIEGVPMDDEEAPDFAGIGIELVKTRGLKDIPIPTVPVSTTDVGEKLAAWLKGQFPADQGVRQGRALAALGAIPEPVDTVLMKAGFLTYQIGGWYDVSSQTLYVGNNAGADGVVDTKENALAISYGHLFKNFNKVLYPANDKPVTIDARLARDSLMGGDAALTRFLHAMQNPSKGGGGGVGEDPDDPSRSLPIPTFLRELELIPFSLGMDFMQTMHSVDGWDQVNAVYSRPPIASAEIRDSELYLSETPFEMLPIVWDSIEIQGKAPFWEDRLGALATVLYLRQHVAAPIAADTAPGWVNDRLLTYDAEGSTRPHAVWQTLWKDSNAADAFFSALRTSLLSRYKGSEPQQNAPSGVLHLITPERVVYVTRTHGNSGVLFIDAAKGDFAEKALRHFGPAAK